MRILYTKICQPRQYAYILLSLLTLSLSSCSGFLTNRLLGPITGNLQQQTDINLVCEGAPSYLLILDSLLVSNPEGKALLLSATKAYSGFSSSLSECGASETRIAAVTDKAHLYGIRLLQHYLPLQSSGNYAPSTTEDDFNSQLYQLHKDDVEDLFWGTFGWISWVQNQKGSPSSIADMAIIEKIMKRLLELDETYEGGSIHLFFGAYHALKPAMLGGRPDLSKEHFEKSLALSKRQFLITQTTYAQTYARSVFDQELHDTLLNEVLSFSLTDAPEFALSNQIAKNRAQKLLEENYFGD
jgi:TRAP transporter T-component